MPPRIPPPASTAGKSVLQWFRPQRSLACGVRPRTGLAQAAGLDVRRGIVVDDGLRTSDPYIHAIGDCADMPASKAGGVAHQEGDVLAHNLAVEITGKGRPVDLWLHTI